MCRSPWSAWCGTSLPVEKFVEKKRKKGAELKGHKNARTNARQNDSREQSKRACSSEKVKKKELGWQTEEVVAQDLVSTAERSFAGRHHCFFFLSLEAKKQHKLKTVEKRKRKAKKIWSHPDSN